MVEEAGTGVAVLAEGTDLGVSCATAKGFSEVSGFGSGEIDAVGSFVTGSNVLRLLWDATCSRASLGGLYDFGKASQVIYSAIILAGPSSEVPVISLKTILASSAFFRSAVSGSLRIGCEQSLFNSSTELGA